MQGKEITRSRLALVATRRKAVTAADSAAPQEHNSDATPSPFSAAVPDRYFETVALRACHSRVARAALDSHTVAVVEGEQGCGKTTFVRMLQKRVGASRDICYLDVRIPQGERYLLSHLQRAFCPGQPADPDTLTAYLIERGRRNGGCLIVVDDADKLSVFAIRLLFMLKRAVVEAGSQLGVVITVSPLKLDAMLELPSFAPYRAHWLTRVELPHFTEQETADYLRTRIETAGLADTISFDHAQVHRIYKASSGLPHHIKRVAGELLDGAKPRRYRSERGQQRLVHHRNTLILVAAVALPVVCIALLLQAIIKRPAGDDQLARLMSPAGIEAAGTAVPLSADQPAPPAATGAVDREQAAVEAQQDVQVTKVAEQSVTPVQKAPVASSPAPVTTADAAVGEPPHSVASLPEVQLDAVPEPTSPAVLPATGEPAADISRLDGNEWLRAQDPDFYTIQLAGSAERKDVEDFIDKYALPGKVVIVEILRNGKVWYMVLYNSYRTSGEARRDLNALPPQVHRNDPFARRFASVQAIALAP